MGNTNNVSMRNLEGRIKWIDSLKGLAILTVILGHVLLGYYENNAFSKQVLDAIYGVKYWIYTWHMPLFILISGYTFSLAYIKREKTIESKGLKQQIVNVALLYLIFQVALCSLKIVFSDFVDNKMDFVSMFENIIFPNNIMWYLWVLVVYYILFGWIVNKIDISSIKTWIVLFIVLVLINIVEKSTAPYMNYRLCFGNLAHCAMYFWIGIGVCKINCIGSLLRSNKVLIVASIYSLIYIVLLISFSSYIVSDRVFYVVLGEINAVMVLVVLIRVCHKIHSKLLLKFGKNCLIVYLLHTYIVTAVKIFFLRMGLCKDENVIIVLTVTWLIPAVLVLMLSGIIDKYSITRSVFKPILFFKKTN